MKWPMKKICDIADLGRGRVISKKYILDNPGPYPVYSSQTQNNGEFGRINSYDFEGEYVTWTTDGANAGQVFYRSGKFNCTNVCGTIKVKDRNKVLPKYLAIVLNTKTKRYVSIASGNPKLMNNVMAKIEIPLPPIAEQKKIVEKIEKLFAKIDQAERWRQEASADAVALFSSALQQVFSRQKWPMKKLGEVLDYEQPTKYLVSSRVYKDEFTTPVLTAGKTFILGNTNEKNGIFPKEKLPVIIFDDFTTTTKFVDFPFKVKSSAIKILHAKKDIADTKYLFYLMQIIRFNHKQHKRYWISEYSQLEIPLPPLAEQKRIVEKIEKLFAKIDQAERLRQEASAEAANLLPSALQQVFSRGKEMGWSEKELQKSIQKLPFKIKGIEKKQYKPIGKFPIIDQGQNLIAGYTNDSSKVFNFKTSVIVFGDHTRILKYVDFPFAVGADGTKILMPTDDYYPKYFYYALASLNIESLGYSRHYKLLKSKIIPLPPLNEQKKIVAYLDSISPKAQELQNLQRQTAADFSALRQSILASAFSK